MLLRQQREIRLYFNFHDDQKGISGDCKNAEMPLEKLFTAFILGLSWDRILVCPFLALGLSLSDRWAGLRFVSGRLLGISLLGLIITLVGLPFKLSPKILDGIFGLFLGGLGISVLFKSEHKNPRRQFSHAGFGLGLFRGLLNPGRKIVYLLPLLWGTRLIEGFIISLVYALSSSAYLLIGFFSAEVLNKFFSYRRLIKMVGGTILILLGFYYILKVLFMKAD